MEKVILRISIDSADILPYVERYINFYNNFLFYSKNESLIFEMVGDGVIAFVKNFPIFNKLLVPKNGDINYLNSSDRKSLEKIYQTYCIPVEIFPSNGYKMMITIIQGDSTKLIPVIIDYLNSFNDKVEIGTITNTSLAFHVKTFEFVQEYIREIILKYFIEMTQNKK